MAAKEGLGFEITELRLGLPGALQLTTPMEFKKTNEVKKRVFADIIEDEENNSAITDDRRTKQIKATQFVGWPPVCSYRKKNNNISKSDQNKQGVFSNIIADEENSSSTVTEDYPRKVQNKATNQVVGWPPVCSYRKKSSASAVVDNSSAKLNIKISMDGAPYLRKIDLNVHKGYSELAVAFEKLFGCFGMGLDSEYIAIYEDKDGDWMLVGDGPYKMFRENWECAPKSTTELGMCPNIQKVGNLPQPLGNQLKSQFGEHVNLHVRNDGQVYPLIRQS